MATYARDPQDVQMSAAEQLKPKRSLEECHAMLTAPGQMHEIIEQTVNGRKMKVFKNCPDSLRDFWLGMQATWPGGRDYLVLDNERVTYAETHRRALVLAEMLSKEYGVKKGDKVAIIMRNRPDWVITFWATALLGGVAVAVNAWLSPEAMVHCLKLTNTVAVVIDEERNQVLGAQAEALKDTNVKGVLVSQGKPKPGFKDLHQAMQKYQSAKDIPKVQISPEDDATIFFTSGTTSFPKAVLSTQRMFMTNLFAASIAARRATLRVGDEIVAPTPDDPQKCLLLPVPLFHVTGTTSLLMIMTATGGKVVFMHKWSVKEALKLIRTEKVTLSGGVPFIVQETLEASQGDDLASLEAFTFGGAPANDSLTPLAAKKHSNGIMSQAYGLSETNSVVVSHAGIDYHMRPLSTGLPTFVNEIRIVDPEGKDVPTGEIGEIYIRGPNVFKEYYKDPKATKAALDSDGWFRSGDLASKDHEGFVYIRDRAKDIIIRGGENIAATAVENALFKNSIVQDCAVVAVSDKKLGELPAAVVVLRPNASGAKESDIIEDSRKYLPRHAVPVMVMLRESKDDNSEVRIERNPNGKIMKKELKQVVEKEWQRRTKSKL